MGRINFPTRRQWEDEFRDLIRGASGGFLFGIPLLYTMEVWWIGSFTRPPLMLAVLASVFVMVFLLNRTDGFRQAKPDRPLQAVMDSVEAVAISLVCVTLVLLLLREINPETSLNEALGKIVLESVPFAIGIGLARSIMVGEREQPPDDESEADEGSRPSPMRNQLPDHYNATLADIGATLVGSIFIAFNIAPTDEVPMLSAAASPPSLLAVIAASLIFSYCIVFAAGFTTQEKRLQQQGAFQRPLVETVIAYLVSLLSAAIMLWFFQRLGFSDPWTAWLEQVLILGLPASIGGAAGRLAV
jgi:putative integral membrane protein (TIGR02587 family)